MLKNFIIDTNVVLHDPNAIFNFEDNNVIIPIEVIEELDNFKRDVSELGVNARRIVQNLDELRKLGKLGEGVKLPAGGLLRVIANRYSDNGKYKKVSNRILNLAIEMEKEDNSLPTIIVSKNMSLRLKADALGIYAEDYDENINPEDQHYNGFLELDLPETSINEFKETGVFNFEEAEFLPNQYLLLKDDESGTQAYAKVSKNAMSFKAIKPVDMIMGLKPLNIAQVFAFDALLDDNIKLVTLMGKAGTGKTLIAVAAGLQKMLLEDKFHKVLVSRPTMPMGRDIGFLPGDIEEKMRPWMQPIFDALELLMDIDKKSRKRQIPPDLLDSNDVQVEPLTYIRGRSIPQQYMIIDEAQNLTPLEVKTIITRAGMGTKIIMTGDPFQIDNPYVDSSSNGFVYLINRFKDNPIAAHISLTKGERSELAEMAANIL